MIELVEQVGMIEPDADLPTGVIVGSAVIERVVKVEARRDAGAQARSEEACGISPSCLRASVPSCLYAWHLINVQRAKKLRKPVRIPQPVWFKPF